ncbi:MAG: hypothetical protein AB7G13_21860 [Lautropia sp.]
MHRIVADARDHRRRDRRFMAARAVLDVMLVDGALFDPARFDPAPVDGMFTDRASFDSVLPGSGVFDHCLIAKFFNPKLTR